MVRGVRLESEREALEKPVKYFRCSRELVPGQPARTSRVKPAGRAGSVNSDHILSGNSGRSELTPSGRTLAAPSSEGRDERHAQVDRPQRVARRRGSRSWSVAASRCESTNPRRRSGSERRSLFIATLATGLTWPHGHGYIMAMKRLAAGKFKDRCLKVLDEVSERKTPVTITKRGRPVATLVPYAGPASPTKSLAGSVLKERGSPYRTSEQWDADDVR
jgi:prevent-host-death family protein